MICTPAQVEDIIKNNPNKELVKEGRDQAAALTLLIHGHQPGQADIKRDNYFENDQIFAVRKNNCMSNKDMFGRLLQREQMVFSAQGGSAYFLGLSKEDLIKFAAKLDNIRFSISLRKWIKQFALPAFRCDPMGIVFVEADVDQNAYPTYKSISTVYDYMPNGRNLEYVCFQLTVGEAKAFGVNDEKFKDIKGGDKSNYYRFIDDQKDNIYKYEESAVTLTDPKVSPWPTVPGFILSDIISFENTQKFLSPVNLVTELAYSFLNDRSVRDLQKKYHGFLKAIEPLLQCGTCIGTGYLSGAACPECTPPGADRGTGYKLSTKVADVARFPLSILKEGFDYKKIFGYAELPIDVWNKQDTSLSDIENLIRDVYWGTDNSQQTTSGPKSSDKGIEETATKTLANLQPIYARLNMTADWAEKTENMVADLIGKYMFKSFKKSSINYGRYYILETPYDLMEEYLEMKSKGSSQSSLFAALTRYIHSAYSADPARLAIELKMINVEPFVHSTITQVQANNAAQIDYLTKLYFSEWRQQQEFDYLLVTQEAKLRESLIAFATIKKALIPDPAQATVSSTERGIPA